MVIVGDCLGNILLLLPPHDKEGCTADDSHSSESHYCTNDSSNSVRYTTIILAVVFTLFGGLIAAVLVLVRGAEFNRGGAHVAPRSHILDRHVVHFFLEVGIRENLLFLTEQREGRQLAVGAILEQPPDAQVLVGWELIAIVAEQLKRHGGRVVRQASEVVGSLCKTHDAEESEEGVVAASQKGDLELATGGDGLIELGKNGARESASTDCAGGLGSVIIEAKFLRVSEGAQAGEVLVGDVDGAGRSVVDAGNVDEVEDGIGICVVHVLDGEVIHILKVLPKLRVEVTRFLDAIGKDLTVGKGCRRGLVSWAGVIALEPDCIL